MHNFTKLNNAALTWTLTGVVCAGAVVELTKFDRRLLVLLLSTFEYWYLLANTALFFTMKMMSLSDFTPASTTLRLLPAAWQLYIISLDAAPVTISPRTKRTLLLLLLVGAGGSLLRELDLSFVGPQLTPRDIQVLQYRTNTVAIAISALVNVASLICKYIVRSFQSVSTIDDDLDHLLHTCTPCMILSLPVSVRLQTQRIEPLLQDAHDEQRVLVETVNDFLMLDRDGAVPGAQLQNVRSSVNAIAVGVDE